MNPTASIFAAFSLEGRTALVTGASSGIGREISLTLARAGLAHLVLVGRSTERLETLRQMLAGQCPKTAVGMVSCDLSLEDGRQTLTRHVTTSVPTLDILINCAGIVRYLPFETSLDTDFDEIMRTNLTSSYSLSRQLLPMLKRSSFPSILNMSSTLALKPGVNTSVYEISKAGLVQMTRSLAKELAVHGIRVNALLPGIVDTPMFEQRAESTAALAILKKELTPLHPLGRLGTVADVAHAALFLVSPAAAWITGAALPVDGGLLCT